jgi:hypothetical protein
MAIEDEIRATAGGVAASVLTDDAALQRVLTRLKTDPSVWLADTASTLKTADGKGAAYNRGEG